MNKVEITDTDQQSVFIILAIIWLLGMGFATGSVDRSGTSKWLPKS
jgi:hypothetical protein